MKFVKLLSAVAIIFAFTARAESFCGMKSQELHMISPRHSTMQNPVQVETKLDRENKVLNVHFTVDTKSPINAERVLGPKQYPFQFDVVEVFISVEGLVGDRRPYFELEVSPYNQTFYVLIDQKKIFHNAVHTLVTTAAQMNGTAWTADLHIPLVSLGWDGDPNKIIGGIFALLGPATARTFWSLDLPPTHGLRPNFHQPRYFKGLVNCAPLSSNMPQAPPEVRSQ